jgi:hypothetical protein
VGAGSRPPTSLGPPAPRRDSPRSGPSPRSRAAARPGACEASELLVEMHAGEHVVDAAFRRQGGIAERATCSSRRDTEAARTRIVSGIFHAQGRGLNFAQSLTHGATHARRPLRARADDEWTRHGEIAPQESKPSSLGAKSRYERRRFWKALRKKRAARENTSLVGRWMTLARTPLIYSFPAPACRRAQCFSGAGATLTGRRKWSERPSYAAGARSRNNILAVDACPKVRTGQWHWIRAGTRAGLRNACGNTPHPSSTPRRFTL